MSSPIAAMHVEFGPKPVSIRCPHCRKNITTKIEEDPSANTHLFGLLLFCFCCCSYTTKQSYCCKCCWTKKHYCPECNALLCTLD